MRYNITKSDAFPLIQITLKKNEEIKIKSGAMIYHTHGVELVGEHSGSNMLDSSDKKTSENEDFFQIRARAKLDNQQIALAPKGIGRVFMLNIGQSQYFLNNGAFLASDIDVEIDMVNPKNEINNLFSLTRGLFIMKTSGEGHLVVNAFGDIQEIILDGTAPLIIDNKHVLCWEETLNYELVNNGGKFSFKNDEGIVNKFTGSGKIYLQTRHVQSLAEIIIPFTPSQKLKTNFTNG